MHHDIHNSVIRDCILDDRLIETSRQIRSVIDTPEFQRLRNIRQTGLTSFAFPTAEHSRFAHSLGVYATALQFFRHLQSRAISLDLHVPLAFDDHCELDFCIAALVHDIGHTAFSHVLETNLLPKEFLSHEDCTKELLSSNTSIARAIDKVADRAAIYQIIDKEYPNKSLNDLVSSTFDVDRCDYILRDSMMTGVKYGAYDLSWLVHSLSVEQNELGQPVLVLDGPRGLDALCQFLSARKYLYRQVYFHSTVRGAQLLLKGVFERIQHTPDHADHKRLAPSCLQAIMSGDKPSLEDFIRTTDIEVVYMIREFAEKHSDSVIRYLSSLYTRREFPCAVINSAKASTDIHNLYRIDLRRRPAEDSQLLLPLTQDLDQIPLDQEAFTREMSEFVASRMAAAGAPAEAAPYLVSFDAPVYSSPAPDLLFNYGQRDLSLSQLRGATASRELGRLLEPFTTVRFYVPRCVRNEVAEHIENNYSLNGGRE